MTTDIKLTLGSGVTLRTSAEGGRGEGSAFAAVVAGKGKAWVNWLGTRRAGESAGTHTSVFVEGWYAGGTVLAGVGRTSAEDYVASGAGKACKASTLEAVGVV